MVQKKKQNKVLYASLVLLIVAASILIAVASGATRRNKPQSIPETTVVVEENNLPLSSILDAVTEPSTEKPVETTTQAEKETEPTVLTVEDIEFQLPVDGEVLVSCSLATPIYSVTMNDYRTHSGVDITASVGDSVMSCADGTVSKVWEDPMMGVSIEITHEAGAVSVYKNLALQVVDGIETGSSVEAGQIIGSVGDTALIECEEESHLHFELMVNGEYVDPSSYIDIVTVSETFED